MAPYKAADSEHKLDSNPLWMRLFETNDKIPSFEETKQQGTAVRQTTQDLEEVIS